MTNQPPIQPTIALLPWGDLIEDFLDTINVSFDDFCQEMTGGWMFGYIEALKLAGVRTVLFCVSAKVTEPTRYQHQPTDTTIWVIPASSLYAIARRPMKKRYGWTLEDMFGEVRGVRRRLLSALKDVVPYLATPLWPLARELRREQCQAILCQEYEYPRFDACVLLGKMLNLPVFATFQGGNFQTSRLERPLRPLTLNQCAGLIIGTQTEITRVEQDYKIAASKVARIFNPMDTTNWQPLDRQQARQQLNLPSTAEIVICHGRIDIYRKGLDLLVDAWDSLCRDRPDRDLRLILIGTGSDADQLSDLIQQRQLRGVQWLNEYVRDRALLLRYLSAADLYTLPSRNEGFPVAPIEAMACGLPIVAADAPGVCDILEQGEESGGIIVPTGGVLQLTAALGRLLDNPAERQSMGDRAYQRTQAEFSLSTVGLQLRQFLLPKNASKR